MENSKIQPINSKELPNNKNQFPKGGVLEFGFCLLDFPWNLWVGIWNFLGTYGLGFGISLEFMGWYLEFSRSGLNFRAATLVPLRRLDSEFTAGTEEGRDDRKEQARGGGNDDAGSKRRMLGKSRQIAAVILPGGGRQILGSRHPRRREFKLHAPIRDLAGRIEARRIVSAHDYKKKRRDRFPIPPHSLVRTELICSYFRSCGGCCSSCRVLRPVKREMTHSIFGKKPIH